MKPIHRRAAAARLVATLVAVPLLPRLAAAQPAGPDLDERDGVAAALGYRPDHRLVDAARFPEHQPGDRCGQCHFFTPVADGARGRCPFFAGKAVVATGWCKAYARRGAADH